MANLLSTQLLPSSVTAELISGGWTLTVGLELGHEFAHLCSLSAYKQDIFTGSINAAVKDMVKVDKQFVI